MEGEHGEFSAAPVGDEQLVPWPRVAAVGMMAAFSLPTFVAGLELYHALDATDLVFALLVGSAIVAVIGCATGTIGVRTRFSSYLLVRIAFGDHGAGLVNLAFALSLLGWFGVNIDLVSGATTELSTTLFGAAPPVWLIESCAGLLMTVTTIFGFRAINVVSSVLVPVMIGVTAWIAWRGWPEAPAAFADAADAHASLSAGDGVASLVGLVIIGAIILPDITRFSRHRHGGALVAFFTYAVAGLFVMSAAALAGAASGRDDMLAVMLDLGLGYAAFIVVIAGGWVLNAFNLYSATLSIEATFPALRGRWVTAALGVGGVLAAYANILDQFLPFLALLATVFVPVAGIIAVDYFFVRPQDYRHAVLEDNRVFAWRAFAGWLVGTGVAVGGDFYGMSTVSGMPTLDSIAAAGLVYFGLARFAPRRVAAAER